VFVVGRKVNMLSKVEGGKKREQLRGEVVCRIIEMNVKVASDDEFIRGGSRTSIAHFRWKGTSPTNNCWVAEN